MLCCMTTDICIFTFRFLISSLNVLSPFFSAFWRQWTTNCVMTQHQKMHNRCCETTKRKCFAVQKSMENIYEYRFWTISTICTDIYNSHYNSHFLIIIEVEPLQQYWIMPHLGEGHRIAPVCMIGPSTTLLFLVILSELVDPFNFNECCIWARCWSPTWVLLRGQCGNWIQTPDGVCLQYSCSTPQARENCSDLKEVWHFSLWIISINSFPWMQWLEFHQKNVNCFTLNKNISIQINHIIRIPFMIIQHWLRYHVTWHWTGPTFIKSDQVDP